MSEYDTVVIHSWIINPDGSQQEEGILRLNEAENFWLNNLTNTITVTGCHDTTDWQAPITHAESMRRYLVEIGVSPYEIFKEELSLDTVGQMVIPKWSVVNPNKLYVIKYVTSDYHVERAREAAEFLYGRDYLVEVVGVPTPKINSSELLEAEKRRIKSFREFWSGVKSGDDEAICERFFSRHNLYNGNYPGQKELGTRFPDFQAYRSRVLQTNFGRELSI